MQNHGIIGSRSRFTGKPGSRSRLEFYVYLFTMQETNRKQSITFLIRYRSGGTPSNQARTRACRRFAGRCPRDQGPPAVLGASRLFVLLVAARRRVLAGNTYLDTLLLIGWICTDAHALNLLSAVHYAFSSYTESCRQF